MGRVSWSEGSILIDAEQVAEIFGMSRRWVDKHAVAGNIPYVESSGRRRYVRKVVEKLALKGLPKLPPEPRKASA